MIYMKFRNTQIVEQPRVIFMYSMEFDKSFSRWSALHSHSQRVSQSNITYDAIKIQIIQTSIHFVLFFFFKHKSSRMTI